jgi:hypothetical protein
VLNKNANQKIFSLLKEGDTYEWKTPKLS